MATDYTYLYEEYPEVISADQLYRICHISKRKAKWLLEHGYIPCEDSGKKTRRYKIRLNDVIDYLLTLEAAPDLVATPVGAFNVKRKQLNPVAQICQKGFQRFLYNIWTDEADILRISDVQVLLGYSAGTIRQWILRKELRSTRLPCGIQVTAKEWLIDFMLILVPVLLTKSNILDILLLGENTAISLGIAVERELRLLLIASVALTSACVAVSGGIGFVGLVAPHMARRLIGGRHHALMPASMLLGALLLLLADTLGRSAFQPREIPVGIVISVLSAPYFLFLLRRYF